MATSRDCRGVDGRTVLRNGAVVTPSGVIPGGRVVLGGDRIVAVDDSTTTAGARRTVDLEGRYVLPGIVDLYADDVERYLFPRSGRVGTTTALSACERATVSAGVTTKFHVIPLEDVDRGDRSVEVGLEVARTVADHGGLVDGRVHAQCELTDLASVAAVESLAEGVVDVVSLATRVPREGQSGEAAFVSRHGADADDRRSVEDATVAARARRVAEATRQAGATLATHGDATPAAVERARDRGATISESPLTTETARRATELGMVTATSAPNLVRGKSLCDELSARDAVDAGVLDVLYSDYYPPSPLTAAFFDTGERLHERVARVTSAPAEAAGLTDRGRIQPGRRADLIVVDPGPTPTVQRAFVAGREVYRVDRTPGPRRSGDV